MNPVRNRFELQLPVTEGPRLGTVVGSRLGIFEMLGIDKGLFDGKCDGDTEGNSDGAFEGVELGSNDGDVLKLGTPLGEIEGTRDGTGLVVGMIPEGPDVGVLLGPVDGVTLGERLGLIEGNLDGEIEGIPVGELLILGDLLGRSEGIPDGLAERDGVMPVGVSVGVVDGSREGI